MRQDTLDNRWRRGLTWLLLTAWCCLWAGSAAHFTRYHRPHGLHQHGTHEVLVQMPQDRHHSGCTWCQWLRSDATVTQHATPFLPHGGFHATAPPLTQGEGHAPNALAEARGPPTG